MNFKYIIPIILIGTSFIFTNDPTVAIRTIGILFAVYLMINDKEEK